MIPDLFFPPALPLIAAISFLNRAQMFAETGPLMKRLQSQIEYQMVLELTPTNAAGFFPYKWNFSYFAKVVKISLISTSAPPLIPYICYFRKLYKSADRTV